MGRPVLGTKNNEYIRGVQMERTDIQKAAQVIAELLNETDKHAIRKIENLIEILGLDFVQTHVEETQRIEAEGGLLIKNGKRRRTTGGVFFHTVKSKLTPEQRESIFPYKDWKKLKEAKKQAKVKQNKDV